MVTTRDCSADDQAHCLHKLRFILLCTHSKLLSSNHTRRQNISSNFLIPIVNKRKFETMFIMLMQWHSFHHGLDSIYMKDLVDWPLMTTKNIKFMTKQDHLLRNFITGMSSSEQPFFSIKSIAMCSNDPPMIKHKNGFHGKRLGYNSGAY